MSAGMPELGSKISLISKADIRYEGRLFTVDPKECTIALASVRSFGTEERETNYPVPAQNQVYDYILFRGSDIKDIRVVNNTQQQPLNDPAIMQLSVPPSMAPLQHQPFHHPLNHHHPLLGGHMAPPMGQFGAAYGGVSPSMGGLGGASPAMGGLGGAGGGGMLPGMGMGAPPPPPQRKQPNELLMGTEQGMLAAAVEPPRASEHASILDIIGGTGGGGGSRSTTPASLGSHKSLTAEQGTQAGASGKRGDERKQVRPIGAPHRMGGGAGGAQQRKSTSQERRASRTSDGQEHNQRQQQPQHQYRPQQMHHQRNNAQHMQGGYNNMHHQQQHHATNQQLQQQGGAPTNQQQQQRSGNWVNRGPVRLRGRPRGGGTGNFNKPINQQGQTAQGGKAKNTLKFENDYDFEQANTEFEELRSQLAKVKVEDAPPPKTPEVVNGDVDKKEKDDSGNETGAGENEPEEEHEVFYDKTKSFFDKISCEAVERAKGSSQRTDWRTERKLNSETFGVAATRRGNFRGRGGYRGGMGYRGGYRGGYRQQQPQQQRRNNDQGHRGGPQQHQQQGIDQNRSVNSAPQPQQQQNTVPSVAGK